MEDQNKEAKQVIIFRDDLRNSKGEKLRKGKFVAQGSHASLGAVLSLMKLEFGGHYEELDSGCTTFKSEINRVLPMEKGSALDAWVNGIFTKICLKCKDETELELLHYKAKEAGLPTVLITDAGHTEFDGVPTKTCIAIGPAWGEDIDKITGHLKLL